MVTKAQKLLGRFSARSFEEYALLLDSLRVPVLRKQQERLIYTSYRLSNRVRRLIGDEPKVFRRVKRRNIIEEIFT